MERLKKMGLKRAFFVLSSLCVVLSLCLLLLLFVCCEKVRDNYPSGGIEFRADGTNVLLQQPTKEQQRILRMIDGFQLFACILLPAGGIGAAGLLFYRIKLKAPISVLKMGTERILNRDLDFSIPDISEDELGQICRGFEIMRAELLQANQELWEQAEDRKRLNAAFSHDLRNPVAVLKGTVKLIQQGKGDQRTFDRLAGYTLRIENYVEAMSSIQRMEQLPVRAVECTYSMLETELADTVKFLAPALESTVTVEPRGSTRLDYGIFLNAAENLISNGARFAVKKLSVLLREKDGRVVLTVMDDGPGFPLKMLREGPKPFGKMNEEAEHFGMGLYSTHVLCLKHGGTLKLENPAGGGAAAAASFRII